MENQSWGKPPILNSEVDPDVFGPSMVFRDGDQMVISDQSTLNRLCPLSGTIIPGAHKGSIQVNNKEAYEEAIAAKEFGFISFNHCCFSIPLQKKTFKPRELLPWMSIILLFAGFYLSYSDRSIPLMNSVTLGAVLVSAGLILLLAPILIQMVPRPEHKPANPYGFTLTQCTEKWNWIGNVHVNCLEQLPAWPGILEAHRLSPENQSMPIKPDPTMKNVSYDTTNCCVRFSVDSNLGQYCVRTGAFTESTIKLKEIYQRTPIANRYKDQVSQDDLNNPLLEIAIPLSAKQIRLIRSPLLRIQPKLFYTALCTTTICFLIAVLCLTPLLPTRLLIPLGLVIGLSIVALIHLSAVGNSINIGFSQPNIDNPDQRMKLNNVSDAFVLKVIASESSVD